MFCIWTVIYITIVEGEHYLKKNWFSLLLHALIWWLSKVPYVCSENWMLKWIEFLLDKSLSNETLLNLGDMANIRLDENI